MEVKYEIPVIELLLKVAYELDARDTSNNTIIPELMSKSWDELVQMVYDIAIELKGENNDR